MKRNLSVMAALAAAAIAASAGAAQQPRAPAWQVDWGEHYCTLVRLPDRGSRYVTGFRVLPGTEGGALVLAAHGSAAPPRDVTAAALEPSGRTFELGGANDHWMGRRRAIVLGGLTDEFLEALGGSGELRLKAGSEIRGRIRLPQSAAAVAALRQCVSRVMREWGLDEAALNALRERPKTTNMFGLRADDYPMEAIRRRSQGRVAVRVDVNSEGRATGCTPVGSSGDRDLDSTTCRVILARGRFSPAIGADGQPTAAQVTGVVTWLTGR